MKSCPKNGTPRATADAVVFFKGTVRAQLETVFDDAPFQAHTLFRLGTTAEAEPVEPNRPTNPLSQKM
ncbi:hypothetical protein BWQ96_08013 [Gracilariopsis chorda]|uniref:Uncharacterized protein n=1 Tax=Gracilariopsis chorda TaxID=448386 RepID=A0A2V3IJM1_9FLOR|nr:hypothetical protein BWQ96_08013 [Gracilariopsis chorda]|eukprot:PXF42294.1 hypothetical protein BWQ96_08013 [Gracilariopsis chorda]